MEIETAKQVLEPTECKRDFSEIPLINLSLSLGAGIFLENYFNLGFWLWFSCALSTLLILLIFIRKSYSALFLTIAFTCAGAALYDAEKDSISESRLCKLYDQGIFKSGDPIELQGILLRHEKTPDGVFLGVEARKAIYKQKEHEVSGFVRLFLPLQTKEAIDAYRELALDYGTYLKISCNLKREDRFRNPGVTPSREILDNKGIDATATIKSPLLIEKTEDKKTWNPLFPVFKARDWMIDQFLEIFSSETASIMIASLLGNDNFLDESIEEAFLAGGIFHLLVISGLQVTFIGGLSILFLKLFTKNKFLQFLLPTLFVWAYTFAVGIQEKPVVRASLMITVILFGKLLFRGTSLLNLLGASTLILLVLKPTDLFDPSFQLTSLCVAAIAATSLPLLEKLKRIGQWKPSEETPAPPICSEFTRLFCESLYWSEEKWKAEQAQNVWSCNLIKAKLSKKLENLHLQTTLRFLFEIFVVSTIIQFWILPLSVTYFNRISVIGFFLNLWTGVLMSVQSLTAVVSVLFYQISQNLSAPFILITEILNKVILLAANLFVEQDLASLRVPNYSGLMSLIYFIYFIPLSAISCLIYAWDPFENKSENQSSFLSILNRNKSSVITSFILLMLVIVFHPFIKPKPDNLLHVEFLDVGQGDSIFIKAPTGETFLIDGGGKPDFKRISSKNQVTESHPQSIGETVVSKFLWQKGYSEIDFLILTHVDLDHIQGLINVARNFRIKTAFFGKLQLDNKEFLALYRKLEKQNTKICMLSRGDLLSIGDLKILTLNPEDTESSSDNNSSLVLRISYKDTTFLLTGDIEKEAETEMLQFPTLLSADVIKVPHHGSKTSSTEAFIKSVKAKYAVISVGKDSPFQHPDKNVVERWKKYGAKVLTTGDNGTIQFISDGKNIELKTFSQNALFR